MAPHHRVLIVEDDIGTLNLLDQIVQRAGYETILARGGREGLDLLRQNGADLVLLDLMMKDVDGWALLETVKADDHLGQIPVIIISAKHPAEDPERVEAHAGMFEEYLVKPFQVDALVARLAQLLS
jgi:DNA-binding response OmpR family regulator